MFEVGMTVKILPNAEYNNRFSGRFGIVEKCDGYYRTIGIRFENANNPASSYGVFWFDKHHIEIIENEVHLMNANFTVASISFLDGTNINREYAYALYDENIVPNDIVVVKTGHHGFALAKVVTVGVLPTNTVEYGREIVSKVDFTAYNERKEKAKHLRELKTAMDKKVEELQHTALYELLAEKDPALKAMLEEYKALIG